MREQTMPISPDAIEVATATDAGGKYTLYTASDFPTLPPMRWVIDDVLPAKAFACIYGPSGVGKSFLGLDMVTAIANGESWFGHKCQSGTAIYIALEGQSGFRRRVDAWKKHRGRSFTESVKFVFDSLDLSELDNPLELGAKIKEEEGGADVIVIDTLNRAAPGADENSSSDMGKIIRGATILQHMTDATVVLIHHPGKDATRGLRGHSSLFAAMDAVIEVDNDGQLIRWKLVKSKDSEDKICHAFNLLVVEIDHTDSGKAITSCVIQEVDGYSFQEPDTEPGGANQQAVLNAVKSLLIQQRIDSFLETPDWPDGFPPGLPYDDVATRIKDTLDWIGPKHRRLRTKEALTALVRQGYLVRNDLLLGLPAQ